MPLPLAPTDEFTAANQWMTALQAGEEMPFMLFLPKDLGIRWPKDRPREAQLGALAAASM